MARTVADVALFLSAIAGPDPRIRFRSHEDGARFRAPLGAQLQGRARRLVARARRHPVRAGDPPRRRRATASVFEDLGCVVEEAEPDFTGVDEAFPTLRYAANHAQYAPLVRQRPEWVKDTIKFEVAQAERRPAPMSAGALARQTQMYDESRQFFERYDVLRPSGHAGRAVRRQRSVSDARSPARR